MKTHLEVHRPREDRIRFPCRSSHCDEDFARKDLEARHFKNKHQKTEEDHVSE